MSDIGHKDKANKGPESTRSAPSVTLDCADLRRRAEQSQCGEDLSPTAVLALLDLAERLKAALKNASKSGCANVCECDNCDAARAALAAALAQARAEEREACSHIADNAVVIEFAKRMTADVEVRTAQKIAAAIRARGEKCS